MAEPCRSCPRKTVDFGGCRCQAFALTGNATATDPACSLSPLHRDLVATAEHEAHATPPAFIYRKPQNSPKTAQPLPASAK
jgi:pyrroloquinoline quinone biosynthesis protein E